jgi:hypothetical protein
MGPTSYIPSVFDRYVVMRRIPVYTPYMARLVFSCYCADPLSSHLYKILMAGTYVSLIYML